MASVIRGDDNFDSGNVVPSTTYDAVGTYVMAYNIGPINPGSTIAGSSLNPTNAGKQLWSTTLSGTWRCMGYNRGAATTGSQVTTYVRIS